MTSAPAIGFEYRPSPGFRWVVVAVALLAIVALGLTDLAWWMKSALAICVLMALSQCVRRMAQLPVCAAGWGADDLWTVHLVTHEDVPATLTSFRVLGVFVLLRLKTTDRGSVTLLLAPDNSDADIRRRLRMRLATLQPDARARA